MASTAWKPYKARRVRVYTKGNKSKITLSKEGFTLAELAIVILILSILLLVVFTVVTSIVKISTQTSPSREAKRKSFFAVQILKSSLDQAYYQYGHKRLCFIGRKGDQGGNRNDHLTFSAVHPEASNVGIPSVREVSYYLKEQENGKYSLMRREDQLVDEDPGKGGAHYEILRDVISLQLQYSKDGKDWLDEWDSQAKNKLPSIVLIELGVGVGAKSFTFKLMAQPGINVK